MSNLKVVNSEDFPITIVVNYGTEIIINPRSSVTVQTNERFDTDGFYVELNGNEGNREYRCKFDSMIADIEIYLSDPIWSSQFVNND